MATIYQNPKLKHSAAGPAPDGKGYTTYREPDTTVPPKPAPVMKPITVDGVTIAEEAILHEAQNHPAESPGAALQAAAEALVIRQLLVNEAGRQGISAADSSTEAFEDAVISNLTEQMIEVPQATDSECRRYYENNRQRFTTAPLYEARHILVAAPETDVERRQRAYEMAQQICDRLLEDSSTFATLATAHSACPSRTQGGNLGQLSAGSTVPEFESAMASMTEGEISRSPVASQFGYHVIALDRVIAPEVLPFEAVRDRIADWMEAQAWSRASAQYVSILAGRAEIRGIEMGGSGSPLVQ